MLVHGLITSFNMQGLNQYFTNFLPNILYSLVVNISKSLTVQNLENSIICIHIHMAVYGLSIFYAGQIDFFPSYKSKLNEKAVFVSQIQSIDWKIPILSSAFYRGAIIL